MSEPVSLWDRVKRARLFQVAAVYLGASWVVLQIADTVVDAFELPSQVLVAVILLLLVGLVVIVATAWVQSLPATTAREQTGELPGDWQIAPRNALSTLRQGRLPHLTWGRAVAGGAVMLLLLFGGTGVYLTFTRGVAQVGPAQAAAAEAADGIAVVPFEVRGGQELEIWREGMMDLLSNGLDGVGAFRTIDSRTLMARWNDRIGDAGPPDLETTLEVARATGARYALVGSVVSPGESVRLVANVYDLETGREVAKSRVEGPAGDVLRLIDELAVGTLRELLRSTGANVARAEMAETITTKSLPAVEAFLEGESHYRKGRFAEAVQSYERAVAADSTFAMALVRLSETYGWLETVTSERMVEVGTRAIAQAHRLSPRYQFIMKGLDALLRNSPDGLESLKDAVRKYPDDPEAWFLLAETYLHVPGAYGTNEDIRIALEHAASLDPGFAPYLVHLAENAIMRGDRTAAESAIANYERLTGNHNAIGHSVLALPLLLGSDEERDAAIEQARSASIATLEAYVGTFTMYHDHPEIDAIVEGILSERTGKSRYIEAQINIAMGRLDRVQTLVADPAMLPSERMAIEALVAHIWNVEPPSDRLDPDACAVPEFSAPCYQYVGIAAGQLRRLKDSERAAARLREEANASTDSASADWLRSRADVVDGTRLWRNGDVSRGRELLERRVAAIGSTGVWVRLELGWLEAEAGRPVEALGQFQSAYGSIARPAALYGMALMAEQMGDREQARTWWSKLVALTSEGDQSIPRIREARAALARTVQEPAGN